jgi:hypothetical protein
MDEQELTPEIIRKIDDFFDHWCELEELSSASFPFDSNALMWSGPAW